jgi:hypothetical protein
MGKKSTPPPPNYTELAKQQGAENKEAGLEQWRLQNTSVTTPYGERKLIADPTQPSGYRIEESLNAEDQARLQQTRGIQSGMLGLAPDALKYLGNVIGKEMDTSGLPAMQGSVEYDPMQRGFQRRGMQYEMGPVDDTSRNRVEQAMLDRYNKFADPKNAQQTAAEQTRIANMGGVTSSAAARRAMGDLRKSQNDAQQEAGWQAIMKGGEEESRQHGLKLANAQFGNQAQQQDFMQQMGLGEFYNKSAQQDNANRAANAGLANSARSQGLQELLNLRQAPLNELMALLGGTQVGPTSFTGGGSANWAPANLYGAGKDQYDASVANANAKNAATSGLTSGLFSLGSAFMMSDRRLKSDIQQIGSLPSGLPVYSYVIFGEPAIGVMADEAERMFPEAVATHPSGFKMVDYSKVH